MFVLLRSWIIPLSFLPTSGLFCEDAAHIYIYKEPWRMAYGILNSINHKNKLYNRLKKARSNTPE